MITTNSSWQVRNAIFSARTSNFTPVHAFTGSPFFRSFCQSNSPKTPLMNALKASLSVLVLSLTALTCHAASYSTSWVGNNGATLTDFVGNCARSLWVSPEGVAYTASMWDEKSRNIGVYQNGAVIGAMGGTNASQGSAIAGDATYLFTAQQSPHGGKIGRFNRATGKRDLLIVVSAANKGGDVITGLAVGNGLVYASDLPGNRVRVFTTAGVFQREWSVPAPGALALENGGAFLWVANQATGEIRRFSSAGVASTVIRLPAASRPSALHITAANELWVGDQGPDQNIKIYTGLTTATPALTDTFGVTGGYLSTANGALRGQAGPLRFTRVVGIGSDTAGRIYVLNNPWGGTTDLGRDGGTDLHCYVRKTRSLAWTAQALNFEAVAAPDPGTDGLETYSGNFIFTGSGGAGYKANTVDPFRYPDDVRLDRHTRSRGEHFGQIAYVQGHRILLACSQNPDRFSTYYFNPATDGLIAIPGPIFGATNPSIRNGFNLAANGDLWIGFDKTNAIQRLPLTGFSSNGAPEWGPPESTPIPASLGRLNRLEYLSATDTMILAGGHRDWTLMGNRVEIYKGWLTGNRTPSSVITLTRSQAKAMTAAGSYLFVGYYAVNNVDVFDLKTGALVLSMTESDNVYVGHDVDSMYGLRAYQKKDGRYLISKDDYNATKNVLYTFVP